MKEGELGAPERDDHGQHRDRASREHEPGHREVVLRHALLDEVADHDEQDQVERLERGELPPAHDPRQEEDEEEREECAEDDVHLSSGPDDRVAVEGEQQLVAVVELDVLGARADGGRVDLEVEVEPVLVASGDAAELERDATVPARFSDRAPARRCSSVMSSSQSGVEHERRVLDLLDRLDDETRLEEDPAAQLRRS